LASHLSVSTTRAGPARRRIISAQPMRASLFASAGRHLARIGGEQSRQPGILPGARAVDQRGRAVDQQPAQVAVAALADRGEPLAAGVPLRAEHRGRPWKPGKACRGTRPSAAAKSEPRRKAPGSTTSAAIALDSTGP
jgi:hypothetical protein